MVKFYALIGGFVVVVFTLIGVLATILYFSSLYKPSDTIELAGISDPDECATKCEGYSKGPCNSTGYVYPKKTLSGFALTCVCKSNCFLS